MLEGNALDIVVGFIFLGSMIGFLLVCVIRHRSCVQWRCSRAMRPSSPRIDMVVYPEETCPRGVYYTIIQDYVQ